METQGFWARSALNAGFGCLGGRGLQSEFGGQGGEAPCLRLGNLYIYDMYNESLEVSGFPGRLQGGAAGEELDPTVPNCLQGREGAG